jgi:hypothetical protein
VRTDGKMRGKLAYAHDTDAETTSLAGTLDDQPVGTPRPGL